LSLISGREGALVTFLLRFDTRQNGLVPQSSGQSLASAFRSGSGIGHSKKASREDNVPAFPVN